MTEEKLTKAKKAVIAKLAAEATPAKRTKLYEEFKSLGRQQKELRDRKFA